MNQKMISYPVKFSNAEIDGIISSIDAATTGTHRDLLIVALIVMALCLSDPELSSNDQHFHDVLDSVATHICWVLQDGGFSTDPKLMN